MTRTGYVVAELIRNPRRTLSTVAGATLGIGLFCGVLFFVDGLSASMTQRAVAPLAIDMQRVVGDTVGADVELTQRARSSVDGGTGADMTIELTVRNSGEVPANEVTVRSLPQAPSTYVSNSATRDGVVIDGYNDNPFSHGPGQSGLNLGTLEPGRAIDLTYSVTGVDLDAAGSDAIASSYSTRESVNPIPANEPSTIPLDELAQAIADLDGVAHARQLSFASLGSGAISNDAAIASGPTKIFAFDPAFAANDVEIDVREGAPTDTGSVLSVEAAAALGVGLGDQVRVALPDGSSFESTISGTADLSRARSLFSSRRGGDLETFVYAPNSILVSPAVFETSVLPAYDRAAAAEGGRLKSPPVREIDVRLDRELLDADPATALVETQRIGAAVGDVEARQDYVLDNISNTLAVAAADAATAKRLFVFLGVPGALLASMLAAYGGSVLADAQRREHAVLRIRGANRRDLLRMLALRTALLVAAAALVGLVLGYLAVALILGTDSLDRADPASLAMSALIGTAGGFVATGAALYVAGRRSIDREIADDRARLVTQPPLWRRARLDMVVGGVAVVATAVAFGTNAFEGGRGSVYFGRAVELNLALLILPITAWIAGSLFVARATSAMLARTRPDSTSRFSRPRWQLFHTSVSRRPWAIGNSVIIVTLIVALATSLASFTSSYDTAKIDDARYANGSDIRVTPSPTSTARFGSAEFEMPGIDTASPVVFGVSNVIVRSARTSDPANLAAIDPKTFGDVARVVDGDIDITGDAGGVAGLRVLDTAPRSVLLSREMADFLQAAPGDSLGVLLARATDEQVDVEFTFVGVFDRLAGFPEGADAVISIDDHREFVPTKLPDFFLLAAPGAPDAQLEVLVASLGRNLPGSDELRIDTRLTVLARDQSSLAALNIAGLVDLDSAFALAMATAAIAIFVFGLLLQRRREYVTLRAQGLGAGRIRTLIGAEAATVAVAGSVGGVLVGAVVGSTFVAVLRPLFVLRPGYVLPLSGVALPVGLVSAAAIIASVLGSRMVSRLEPTELLRDE